MLFRPPRYILLVQPHSIELWRRHRHLAERLRVIEAGLPDAMHGLTKLLQPTKGRRLLLLLNLPDLQLESEAAPKAGWLDRRKIIQRRLDYLFHNSEMRAHWRAGSQTILMAGLRSSPWLKTIIQTVGRSGCFVSGVHHLALEALALLPAKRCNDGLLALKHDKTISLIAYQNYSQVKMVRLLTSDTILAHELEQTCHYMRRAGWTPKTSLDIFGFGIVLPPLPNWPQIVDHSYPEQNGLASLLGLLFTRPAKIKFKSPMLHQRQLQHKLRHWCLTGSLLAVVANILLWASAIYNLQQIDRDNADLQIEISRLPPAMVINTEATFTSLMLPRAIGATLEQLAMLPIRSFSLTLPTPRKPSSAELRLQTDPLPNDVDLLLQLPGWTAGATATTTQGSLGSNTELKPQAYYLTYQAVP